MDEYQIMRLIKVFEIWFSFILFISGSALLLIRSVTYSSLEKKLSQQIGGIKKISSPVLEKENYSFHNWLLRHKIIFGVMAILCALAILVFLLNV